MTLSPDAVGWVRVATDVFAGVDSFSSSATNQGVTVVAGSVITEPLSMTGYETTWSTLDGMSWKPSDYWSAREENSSWIIVAAYALGFLAFTKNYVLATGTHQTIVHSSNDGDAWQQVALIDDVEASGIAVAGNHLVLTGSDSNFVYSIWTSSDGRAWVKNPDPAAGRIATVDSTIAGMSNMGFLAVVQRDGEMAVWRSVDGGAWTKAATLAPPKATDDVDCCGIAVGERGIVLTAAFIYDSNLSDMSWTVREMTWWSADGSAWERVADPPTDVTTMLAHENGFIAGAYGVGDACCTGTGIWDGRGKGATWVSDDGKSWRLIFGRGWKNQWLNEIQVNGNTLVGLSIDPSEEFDFSGGLWLANLDTFGQ